MEPECVAGLYQSLGISVGQEFSPDDVCLLYSKVFHVPANMDEAHAAMKQFAGDSCCSCVGENVFDVLLEMEQEREKKEKLFWDLQLLSAGNVNNAFVMEKHVLTDPGQMKHSHCPTMQTEKLLVGNEKCERVRSVKRLQRAARQCWIRLASEGVHSILPSTWWSQSLRVKGHAWGCVSLSDAFLLVDVKYDVVTHLLYSEMLQEHHTESVWESLPSWQRHREEEGLEELAEEALESGDMLRLAELPGAFRMYRLCLNAWFRSSEFREQWCSAASLLYETHTCRQQERDKLTELGQRLDREGLKAVCLRIRLGTLRAQREKRSYCALLAVRQSWETWPHVSGPGGAEQAALWLHDEDDDEPNEDLISVSTQQQAVLQLLVLTQDQERRHLIKLIHGVSLEDLQGPVFTATPEEEGHNQTALRNGCIKRLSQILSSLQTQSHPHTPSEQTSIEPHLQAQIDQIKVHTCSEAAVKSQYQLQHCALLLLTQLQEHHDLQASALLRILMDKGGDHLQVLQDKYDSELGTQGITNLLQFLISKASLTSCSVLVSENNNELHNTLSSATEVVQSMSSGPAVVLAVFAERDLKEIQAAAMTNQQDVCTDCGFVMEEMPYLEILCFSDAPSKTHHNLTAGGEGPQEENGGSATRSPQTYEKQGSLIALAWSKPPEDDDDYDAEAADRVTELSQHCDSSVKASEGTAEYTQCEETSEDRCDGCNSAEETELTLKEKSVVDQSCKTEAVTECDLQTHASVTVTQQVLRSCESTDPHEMKPHSDDLCSGETSDTAEVDVEMCLTATESELLDLGGPEPTHTQDQKHHSLTTSDFTETLMVREQVSAMERENTIRNLVDMQRKVEQRQQRDKERQLLRVRERLSIIQSRKAEEDLLGLKVTDELRHLTQGLPQEDKNRQKTVVRERLEQLRRERSYVLQSKRDRNTAGFKELLGPVALSRETEDEGD